jgi:hypothetical protein
VLRTIVPAVLGAVFGFAAMHLFQDNGTAPADLSVVTKESASQGAAVRGADPAVGPDVAAYRAAADFSRAAD